MDFGYEENQGIANVSDAFIDDCTVAKQNSNFHWNDTTVTMILWLVVAVISFSLCLAVFLSAYLNESRRKAPANLMIARALVDLLYIGDYYVMIFAPLYDICRECNYASPIFLLGILTSEIYFFLIIFDFYRTLSNPFATSISNSKFIHFFAWGISATIVAIFSIDGTFSFLDSKKFGRNAWGFRSDYEICFIKFIPGTNIYNVFFTLYTIYKLQYCRCVCYNLGQFET